MCRIRIQLKSKEKIESVIENWFFLQITQISSLKKLKLPHYKEVSCCLILKPMICCIILPLTGLIIKRGPCGAGGGAPPQGP